MKFLSKIYFVYFKFWSLLIIDNNIWYADRITVIHALPVPSDGVQSGHEASPLCERDHPQPEQQEPAVRRWHVSRVSVAPHTAFKVKVLNAPVCPQDQSSGPGAAGGRLPCEGRPWHHPLGLWQLQRGSYSLLWISSQTMWWSCFLYLDKVVLTFLPKRKQGPRAVTQMDDESDLSCLH